MWWRELYPGHGPWAHLPPWKRPGHWSGRGWCRWSYSYSPLPWMDKEGEIRYLEEVRKYLSDVVLKDIEQRLQELREGKQ